MNQKALVNKPANSLAKRRGSSLMKVACFSGGMGAVFVLAIFSIMALFGLITAQVSWIFIFTIIIIAGCGGGLSIQLVHRLFYDKND